MSYDIWLEVDVGGRERLALDDQDPGPGNYTYNVDPMFALALERDATAGVRNGYELLIDRKRPALARFEGRRAGDCVAELAAAVDHMARYPEMYEPLNPPNGWGDYAGALAYLRRFLRACERAPDAVVEMSL